MSRLNLVIDSECQYLLLGLKALLPNLIINHPSSSLRSEKLIVASTPGRPYADLLDKFQHHRRQGFRRVALMGGHGEATFLAECGYQPEGLFSRTDNTEWLKDQIEAWLRNDLAEIRMASLTSREREAITHSLRMLPPAIFAGGNAKLFYNHRRQALRKLGLKKVSDMMVDTVTGTPISKGNYIKYLTD